MSISRTKPIWYADLIFIILFAALCWYYSYNITFPQHPQSTHTWRQTNCLSITQMYYQYNLPFLQPEIHNQMCDGGLSGKTAGEFPIIYFVIAKIWQVFGKSELIYRLFQLLILFIGIFLLYKMLAPITGTPFRAGFVSMLVFTSPMFVFYGPNFLPDAPALAFTFIAWYFLYRFVVHRKYSLLWISSAFFFLAISLKITSATSLIAFGTWLIFETLFMKPEKRLFDFRIKHFIPFILSTLLVFGWYLYVNYYNGVHQGSYSTLGIWPLWKLSAERFRDILDAVKRIYLREYFSPPLQYVTILIWIFMLFNIRKVPPFARFLLILMPVSFISVIVLWFDVLDGHDYYLITQMQVLVIVWAIFFSFIKDKKHWNHPLVNVLILAVFALLANDGRMRHHERYKGWMNKGYKLEYEALTEIEPYFKKWNIVPEDRVICVPDPSINASLYYMNRKGNTNFGNEFSREEAFRKQIRQGAGYLVIIDTAMLKLPVIQKFATDFVGQYKNVKVYRLKQ